MNSPTCRYEELGHTAEVGLRLWAPGPADLYACAAQAMFALLDAPADPAAATAVHQLTVESLDAESLLVDWLSELLYLHETTGEIYLHCAVDDWSPTRLAATVTGQRPSRPPRLHIKAVTYHQLAITPADDGWTAELYFDI